MKVEKSDNLFVEIRDTILKSRTLAYKSSNAILLNMYWEIGRIILKMNSRENRKSNMAKRRSKILLNN